jgi:dihydropteroate synthase
MKDTQFIGVLNLTPDSFSDGGRFDHEDLVEVARGMLEEGATILEIGGESTAPNSVNVSLEEELKRVSGPIRALRAAFPNVILSIDTWKSEVAELALKEGFQIVNDVTAGRMDPRILEVVARFDAIYLMMHSKDSTPRTTREVVEYEDIVAAVLDFLRERMQVARAAGVREIWVDPGMGAFLSGDPDVSFELIERISELDVLAVPVVVGASRKGFLGEDRLGGTLWTTLALQGKVDYLRVHDVLENASASC